MRKSWVFADARGVRGKAKRPGPWVQSGRTDVVANLPRWTSRRMNLVAVGGGLDVVNLEKRVGVTWIDRGKGVILTNC